MSLTSGCLINIGERPASFIASDYPDDEALISHIKQLSDKEDYVSREELIDIVNHIQTHIVKGGKIAEHMALVSAILGTGMPGLDYPVIAKEFEMATNTLAKSNAMTRIELAPAYFTLWSLTLKSTYLTRFEKTARQCYLTLANGKHYPDLGVDITDRQSLTKAIKFLDENRRTLWILNEKYDVDKVVEKYKIA